MRQILIVHSSMDDRFQTFFSKIFMTAAVKVSWETYERVNDGTAAREEIKRKIAGSDALFFVLSTDLEFDSLAKKWFPWAIGLAEGKDIWVFEHCEDLKRVQPLIPGLTHYAVFYITNAWSDHVGKILEIYEKPKAPAVSLPEAVLKALTPVETDAWFNPATGFALFDNSTDQPSGMRAVCPGCGTAFDLHAPSALKVVRCPACGHFNGLQAPPKTRTTAKA